MKKMIGGIDLLNKNTCQMRMTFTDVLDSKGSEEGVAFMRISVKVPPDIPLATWPGFMQIELTLAAALPLLSFCSSCLSTT